MSAKLPACIIWCLLWLALLIQRISGATRPATRAYVSGSWGNVSLNGMQNHVQLRRMQGLASCVNSALSRGLPFAGRCAKAASGGRGRHRHSGFCSSLEKSSFTRKICRIQTKAPQLQTLHFPRKRGMQKTSGASFAWRGGKWQASSFQDSLLRKVRSVAEIFSWRYWREQTGRTMRCVDCYLHPCMSSGCSPADIMAYKAMEMRASALLPCMDLGRGDMWDPMQMTATVLEAAQVQGGPRVTAAVPRDSHDFHGYVQLGVHTHPAASLRHVGTFVSSTPWGKRFKVLKRRRPTRRYRRGRRACWHVTCMELTSTC